jgi:hypothetical protein
VYEQEFDSGGHYWRIVFNRIMIAILLAQLTIAVTLSVKEAKIQVGLQHYRAPFRTF